MVPASLHYQKHAGKVRKRKLWLLPGSEKKKITRCNRPATISSCAWGTGTCWNVCTDIHVCYTHPVIGCYRWTRVNLYHQTHSEMLSAHYVNKRNGLELGYTGGRTVQQPDTTPTASNSQQGECEAGQGRSFTIVSNLEQQLSTKGAEDEEKGGERKNSCSRSLAAGRATPTASKQLIRNFHGSREVIILKLSAANSMAEWRPGISPSRWWMHAPMRAEYVFTRVMADERPNTTDTHSQTQTHMPTIMNSRAGVFSLFLTSGPNFPNTKWLLF